MATDLWPMMSLHMMMCSNSISWNVDSKGCVSNTAAHNAFAVYSATHCLELAYKIKMKWSSPLGFTYFKLFVTDTNSTHLILFRSFLLKQRWTTDHCTFSFLVWDVNTVTCMYGWDGGEWGGCTCLCICFQWSFTSTETRSITDREPSTATSTFTQLMCCACACGVFYL